MGRPPIGQRAMTSAERQRRFLARIRGRAAASGAAAPEPSPPPFVAPDGCTIRIAHLAMDPICCSRCLRQILGNHATRDMIDGLTQALADQTLNVVFRETFGRQK